MKITIKPKNGKPIVKRFSDPKKAIAWINSTTAEVATQQSVRADGATWTCKNCGRSWYDMKAVECGLCHTPRH